MGNAVESDKTEIESLGEIPDSNAAKSSLANPPAIAAYTIGKFLSRCRELGYQEETLNLFEKAAALAAKALQEKKRLSGEGFAEHNLRVGLILAENKSAPEVVLAGILHGLLDCHAEILEICGKLLGEEVYRLVAGVQEIKEVKSKSPQLQAEALRTILLTTWKDTRLILITLANKLDNMRSIGVLPEARQKIISRAVLEVYAPLASRLGMEKIRVELEDSAFRVLHPRKYAEINAFFEENREEREAEIRDAISQVRSLAEGRVNIIRIKGRSKHIYSIYRKMSQRGVRLKEQYDLLGIRVIVPEVKDCYTFLGLLHEKLEPLPDRLKDYIANPKPNFYQSIHTGVKLPDGKILEVQIRTSEMNEFAEEGIAAHWRYKGMKSEGKFEKKVAWLRNILELQKEIGEEISGDRGGKEFLDAVKIDLFGDEIYCYTPKGDVRRLPLGAMVLDFAYAIHEEVGNHAVGARVNGNFVPLKHRLAAGDVVEILTNKRQRPRRGWVKLVKSARAKQKIRKQLKLHEKLPALHYRSLKPVQAEGQGILVTAPEFPSAGCLLAKCCLPLPGDDIVGLITKRRLISAHRRECRQALKEEERWVAVGWKNQFNQRIAFFAEADERSGLLADLLHTIARAGFEVKDAKAKLINLEYAQCSFVVIPRDLEQLKELVRRVQGVKGVKRVYFE